MARAGRRAGGRGDFDPSDPGNISPFVAYLATADCPVAGKIFFVWANKVALFQPYTVVDTLTTEGPTP